MRKQTDTDFSGGFGKMVKGKHSTLLESDQLSDTQNMQPGYGWKQRRGMSALTASAVASGLRWKSLCQFRELTGTTDVLLAHTYDASGGEDLYQGSALPPNAITWTKKYDLTASCSKCQFANVASAILIANNKDFLIWRGTSHKPSGVWFYDQTNTAYVNYYDEMTDGDTSTSMDISSMTTSDEIVIMAEMPLDKWTPTIGNANGTESPLLMYYWNGSWTAYSIFQSDGTWLNDDFDTQVTWTTNDQGAASSTWGVDLDGEETCYMITGVAGDEAQIRGTLAPSTTGTRQVVGMRIYLENVGTHGAGDSLRFYYQIETAGDDVKCSLSMANDGIYVHNGSSWSQCAGITSLDEDTWYNIVLDIDVSTPATATVDIWVNGVKSETGKDCSLTGTYTNGYMDFVLYGDTTANQEAYISMCNAGPNFGSIGMDDTGTFTDGTASGGATMAQTGDVAWTISATDEVPTLHEGVYGYAYKFKVGVALDSSVSITGMTVHSPMASVKNMWDGQYINPTACLVYNGSDYTDATAYVNNMVESQYADLSGATTSYALYVGFPYRVSEIVFSPAALGKNSADAQIDYVGYYNTAGAATSLTFTDTTLDDASDTSFSQKGSVYWGDPGRYSEKMTKIGGDRVPHYWYKIEWDATLTDPTYIYNIQGVPIYDNPDYSYGVFAYKRRAWQIAPLREENALRYSMENMPNVWNGPDAGYLWFGERPLRAAAPFYNEAIIFADNEMWMLQGNKPANFGRLRLSGVIGTVSPQSIVSVESGVVVNDTIKIVLVWFFTDGIWMFDGVRLWKISAPDIDSFFDPDHDDYINPAKLSETTGVYDFETQCVMWNVYSGSSATTPTKTLVLHFPTLQFGIYDYATDLDAMLSVINTKYYTVAGGHSDGRFYQINSGNTDLSGGTATAVDAYVITRDEFMGYSEGTRQRLLSVWVEAQAAGGQLEVDEYPDGSKTPQNIAKISLQKMGKIFTVLQRTLKLFVGQKSSKFRIRNRSKNARLNLLGKSVTADKDRANE